MSTPGATQGPAATIAWDPELMKQTMKGYKDTVIESMVEPVKNAGKAGTDLSTDTSVGAVSGIAREKLPRVVAPAVEASVQGAGAAVKPVLHRGVDKSVNASAEKSSELGDKSIEKSGDVSASIGSWWRGNRGNNSSQS